MRTIIVAIIAVALIATSGLAIAQGWGRGNGPGLGFGPCANGYSSTTPAAWSGSNQYQKNLTPDQQAQLGVFSGGRGWYGPGYGMRGGLGPGRGMGRGVGFGNGICPRW